MPYKLRKKLRRSINKLFYSLSVRDIEKVLVQIGVGPGKVVCVHSALGSMGHLKDGPEGLIKALQNVLGPTGTLVMPTFSMGGSMAKYVASGECFDVRTSPSKTGAPSPSARAAGRDSGSSCSTTSARATT